MYKVFFNNRTILLTDKLPDIQKTENEYFCTFNDVNDLKPQLSKYLDQDSEGDLYIYHDDEDKIYHDFTSCFRVIKASGGLVKDRRKNKLIIFRKGKWDLPKGKAEGDEKPEETALREVREECGLKQIEITRFLATTYHIYFLNNEPVLKKTDWFEMKYLGKKSPVPSNKENISKIIWLPDDKLDEIYNNTYPSVIEVIRAAI